MEQSKKTIVDVLDDMVLKKELQFAGSLCIPFFVMSHELCNKASLNPKRNGDLIKNVLIEKFGDRIAFSTNRAYHKYRGRMRRGVFVYNIDLSYNSEKIKLYLRKEDNTSLLFDRYCKTKLVFDPEHAIPFTLFYKHFNAYVEKKKHEKVRPMDIKKYLMEKCQVKILAHKRRKYKDEFYHGNFFVGVDLK